MVHFDFSFGFVSCHKFFLFRTKMSHFCLLFPLGEEIQGLLCYCSDDVTLAILKREVLECPGHRGGTTDEVVEVARNDVTDCCTVRMER